MRCLDSSRLFELPKNYSTLILAIKMNHIKDADNLLADEDHTSQSENNFYLLIVGKSRTTSKNFFKATNKAVSVTVGLGSPYEPSAVVVPLPVTFELIIPFVATLFFFKRAAEKPEAQTYTIHGRNT